MKEIIPEGKKVRVVALGCGSKIPELLMKAGSSAWLDSINILYSFESIKSYMGWGSTQFEEWSKEKKAVSQETANMLVRESENVITFVFTAALGYEGQREGRVNRFFVSTSEGVEEEVILDSNLSREKQEQEVANYILQYFFRERTKVIFAGSFNPWHEAHQSILDSLSSEVIVSNKPIVLDITCQHPDKGGVALEDIQARIDMLNAITSPTEFQVVQSDAPKFIDKYHFHQPPEEFGWKELTVFVVGYDVWEKYHESWEDEFENIDNASFLVFNRFTNDRVITPSPILHPASFKKQVPEELLNISSTAIRENNGN